MRILFYKYKSNRKVLMNIKNKKCLILNSYILIY